MDTTENKEQYTLKYCNDHKPIKPFEWYDTDKGKLWWTGAHWETKKDKLFYPNYFFEPSPMEVKDAEADYKEWFKRTMHPDFKNDETQYKLCRMAYMGAIKKFSLLQDNETVTSGNTFSQLQPPVISAEAKIDAFILQEYNPNADFSTRNYQLTGDAIRNILKKFAEFLQRQGQKTNQNKL